MATGMDADSEVLFKEKQEEKGRTLYQEGRPDSQAGGVRCSILPEDDGRETRGPDGRDQGRSGTMKTGGSSPGNGPATESGHGMPLVSPERTLREGVPNQHNRRMLEKRSECLVYLDDILVFGPDL